ncbi:unnamed protein product [Merluccius merluccius]
MNVKRHGDVSLLILICHGYIVWVKGGDGTGHPMHHTANCALMDINHVTTAAEKRPRGKSSPFSVQLLITACLGRDKLHLQLMFLPAHVKHMLLKAGQCALADSSGHSLRSRRTFPILRLPSCGRGALGF